MYKTKNFIIDLKTHLYHLCERPFNTHLPSF